MTAGELLIVLVGVSVLLFGQQKSSVSWAGQAGMKPGEVFRDRLKNGSEGPEMVVIPPGKFRMGDIQGKYGKMNYPFTNLTSKKLLPRANTKSLLLNTTSSQKRQGVNYLTTKVGAAAGNL